MCVSLLPKAWLRFSFLVLPTYDSALVLMLSSLLLVFGLVSSKIIRDTNPMLIDVAIRHVFECRHRRRRNVCERDQGSGIFPREKQLQCPGLVMSARFLNESKHLEKI